MKRFQRFLNQTANVTEVQFAAALPYFERKNIAKGEYLLREGRVCRHISFILKGTVKVYYTSCNGTEITSCFCTEDHFTTAYESFLTGQPSTKSLLAIEACELVMIEKTNLETLYGLHSIWQTVGRVMAEQEYMTMEKYASTLNSQTAKEKYIQLVNEQPHVLSIAKVEDVASYLGVTRRTLSRIRREVSDG